MIWPLATRYAPILATLFRRPVFDHPHAPCRRLTDTAPKPGEYLFFTQGVRLIGTNVVLFTLLSNDKDQDALNKTLAIVESVRLEAKPK